MSKKKYEIITITCPKCKKSKKVAILKVFIKPIGSTILSVPYITCDHSYIMFLSPDFRIRGYQMDDGSVIENPSEHVKIKIECPECQKIKIFNLEKTTLSNKGITNIYVPPGIICKHSFHIYLDRNYRVRDITISDGEINKKNVIKSIDETFKDALF